MSANQQLLLGEGAGGAAATYIENVFSTYLYTGTGAALTITNNINLSGSGGLVWIKSRSATTGHRLTDTVRGVTKSLASETTAAEATESTGLTAFGTTGFTLGADADYNTSAATYASWTFREQPKFFDVVTYTGDGANRTIAHNLGSVPGCIIVKRTDTTGAWQVYHRSLSNTEYLVLNTSAAVATGATRWNSTTATSSVFSLGTDSSVNAAAGTYVAYIFAHDAGGFGLAATDNVISCGSFTADGSGVASVTLGYEPQWILAKSASGTSNWWLADNMRGMTASNQTNYLSANTANQEVGPSVLYGPTATGFNAQAQNASETYIYIAIRRGPMKVPTSGTSVLGLNARTGTDVNATVTGSAGVSDLAIIKNRGAAVGYLWASRLTANGYLSSNNTTAETTAGATILQASPWDVMDGIKVGTTSTITNASANTFINYLFDRAPGFFDVVCWTATGAVQTVNHNLTVAPELIIAADRSIGQTKPVGGTVLPNTNYLVLNSTAGSSSANNVWDNTSATATTFTLGATVGWVNSPGDNNIAYLFATCAGVSKVGSYTGNGTSQTIACGFTAGSRFVMIKRTNGASDWYVWDSTRGIVAGNDPHISLNTTAAEVTTDDSVDTDNSGFIVNQDAATNVNLSAITYIFLAIA